MIPLTADDEARALSAWAHAKVLYVGEDIIFAPRWASHAWLASDGHLYGSSPLTRGKLVVTGRSSSLRGLIPAHAGKTRLRSLDSTESRAHPRSRGENRAAAALTSAARGSSPLTRGKRGGVSLPTRLSGLIPAHAGKTPIWRSVPSSGRAHPRSRGENRAWRWGVRNGRGSSPLTRGKHPFDAGVGFGCGLIPAHAGKTLHGVVCFFACAAHPRSRGENHRVGDLRRVGQGSSPLTRGKHQR